MIARITPTVSIAVALVSTAASADERSAGAIAWPPKDETPVSEITILAPREVPKGTVVKVMIDGIEIDDDRLGQPIAVAPGPRRVRYALREGAAEGPIREDEVVVERGARLRFAVPALEKKPHALSIGLGIVTAIAGAAGLGGTIWAFYLINKGDPDPASGEEKEGGDYRDLANLVGGVALLGSIGLTAGGIAISVSGASPQWTWSEPAPVSRVRGLAVTWSF